MLHQPAHHQIASGHQRASGSLRLGWKRRGDLTVLGTLRQEGCLKARFPRTDGPMPEAVTLNTAGGVAGGDCMRLHLEAAPGTDAVIASQAAERIYRALPHQVATIETEIHVHEGARLEWLPQETILFDAAALDRRLTLHLAPGATVLALESLVFGRTAMGEEVRTARLRDRILLRREGRLVLHDALRIEGPVAPVLDRAAVAKGGRAIATLVLAGPGAEALLEPLRATLARFEGRCEAGATTLDGMLLARIVAPDGQRLREAVVAGLNILRRGRTLPRTWLC